MSDAKTRQCLHPGCAFPFAGVIVDQRPYPPTGLTTALWPSEAPLRVVYFKELWLTQSQLDAWALFGHSDRKSDDYPHAVSYDGRYYLEDGHNRVVSCALTAGVDWMLMRVFRRYPMNA